jgi:hypothetical protein
MAQKRCAGPAKELRQAADLVRSPGGIMHLKRTIIIPAIMALSAVGSVLAGSAVTLAATSAPSAVVATASHVHPDFVYNG